MGYNHTSKVQTEKLADADAFTTWLAEVANGELKAPVEGRDMVSAPDGEWGVFDT